MKLEVGMYVRTDTGIIEKLEGIHKQNKTNNTIIKLNKMGGGKYAHIVDFNSEFEKEFDKNFSKGNVIKSSHSIIDLIQVGDYVNGYPVYEILEYKDNTRAIVIGDDNKSIIWEESSQYIKSILTKEQFSAMEYRLGDK